MAKLGTKARPIIVRVHSDEMAYYVADADGNARAITFAHASERTDAHHIRVEGIAA